MANDVDYVYIYYFTFEITFYNILYTIVFISSIYNSKIKVLRKDAKIVIERNYFDNTKERRMEISERK